MADSKYKDRFTISLSPEINQAIRHMAVNEKTPVSLFIEKLIKKAIEWEKLKKI